MKRPIETDTQHDDLRRSCNMTRCEYCGKENEQPAEFCFGCGSSFREQAEAVRKAITPTSIKGIVIKAIAIYIIIIMSAVILFWIAAMYLAAKMGHTL